MSSTVKPLADADIFLVTIAPSLAAMAPVAADHCTRPDGEPRTTAEVVVAAAGADEGTGWRGL
jgi:hypothetical protein